MDSFVSDLRFGLRMLWKTPGLSLVAVLTIALGVGLTTHTFSVVYGSVLRGLDFDEGTPLISLSEQNLEQNDRGNGIPILDLLDWRSQQTSFRGLAAFAQGVTVNLADEGSPPERYVGARVSANLFEQVDGVPILGRVFNPEEDTGAAERVVILGYDVWQTRYAGAADIIGRSVRVNSERTTVVGVMPEGFHFPFEEDVWIPLGVDPLMAVRGSDRVEVVGRLLEGVELEEAEAQMQGIARRIAGEYPETNEGVGVWVQTYEDRTMPPEIVAILWIMLGAVFGVLLIACFNVANLLLARATIRARDVAVRSALGADRWRLIRQLLIESALLAVLGGAVGVLLAWIGVEAFSAAISDIQKPYWIDVRLDTPALLFTLGITAFASIASGTIPAMRASGANLHDLLQDEGRGSSSLRMGRFSGALVIGEIALSSTLLVAAGMMIKSVVNVNQIDLGFESEQLFTSRLGLFEADYPDDESRQRFFDRLQEDISANPEVTSAALTMNLPASGASRDRIALEGVAYPEVRDRPLSWFTGVTPGYFETLGMRFVEGRDFTTSDREGSPHVAIVNESFAMRHFGSTSPMEQRFQVGIDGPWITVVGLVPDIFMGQGGVGGVGLGNTPTDQFYLPLAQRSGVRFVSLIASTRGDPGAFANPARTIVQDIDPGLPLYWVRTMDESIETGTWVFKIFGSLFSIFGATALFLAGVGLYGVMAFSVGRRTQEMGIRIAMGASARTVFGLVLGKGMKQLGIGAVVGLAGGAAMARQMTFVFFEVEPSDPLVYAAIVTTLGIAGLMACVLPARRATRIELVEALRPQ
jgi:predicted permease